MEKTCPITLRLRYCKGLFNEVEFEQQKQKLADKNIQLVEFDQNGMIMNCIEPSTVSLTISNPLVQGILIGVTANYITKFVDWALKSLKNKYIWKCTPGSAKQEIATFSLCIEINETRTIDFKFTDNMSEKQQEKCINKVFEFLQNVPPKKDIFPFEIATYNYDDEKWELLNIREELKKQGKIKE